MFQPSWRARESCSPPWASFLSCKTKEQKIAIAPKPGWTSAPGSQVPARCTESHSQGGTLEPEGSTCSQVREPPDWIISKVV